MDLKDRLASRITVDSHGCWRWNGAKSSGYGRIKIARRLHLTHRVSWEIHIGEIPDGLNVCHKCDVRDCLNPEHLFIGTQSENMIDAYKKGRIRITYGPRPNDFRHRGESNHNAKLNRTILSEAAILRKEGATYRSLGLKYGVNIQTIRRALIGEGWKIL